MKQKTPLTDARDSAAGVAGHFARTLEIALNESVKLQAHYAKLLNMHDGGQRTVFKNTNEWLARLEQMEAFK